LCLFFYSPAQWVQTNGPFGGKITCFAVDSTIIFAGTYSGGVFVSTDNGQSWNAVKGGIINTNIYALASDGTNLFAGASGPYYGGFFISTNNGSSWTSSGFSPYGVTSLVVSGTNFYAGNPFGLYLSTNKGTSWSTIMPNTSVTAIAVQGTNLFVSSGWNVSRSTDNGTSWMTTDSGLAGNVVECLAISGTNIFAGTILPVTVPVGQSAQPGGGIFLSTNNGISWAPVKSGLPNKPVSTIAVKDANLFAGTSSGVFRSTNNGTSWVQMNSGLTDTNIYTFTVKGANLFVGTDNGIFFSTNNGESWSAANNGIINTSISALAFFNSNLYAGDNGILLSTNNGISWTAATSTIPYISSFAMSGTNLFAGLKFSTGILRSTNNGINWTLLDSGLTNANVTCFTVSGSNIFAGDGQTGHGVFLSTNNGTSWISVNSGLTNTWIYSLAASSNGNGTATIFAGTQNGGVFRSTNNGTSWTLPSSDLSTNIVFSLLVDGTNLFAGAGGGVFLSTDNGTSWHVTGLTNANVSCLAISGENLFAGTIYSAVSNGGIFLSTDHGANWASVNTGLTNTNISSLAVSETDLFAGTYGSGTWRRSISEMVTAVKGTENQPPTTFSLLQNYPNPFNPTTTIRYSAGTYGRTSIKVYDILGREVATLVNETKAAGTYHVIFDASKLPSGVYFYQLQTGGYSETKKLLLVK
ncbi:MAG TPA: T9SS type A sorting domain-containing protein, partial [Bacteroidota bacterium]|nr:T9SS type A sorting domain-containing protein [Bacteroidota bacterium]